MDKVVHFEIPAEDMNRAKKFYKDIFSWELVDISGMEYTLVRTVAVDSQNMPIEVGAINGGITKKLTKDEAPVVVIDVPSIDDYIQKISAAGGKVVRPKMSVLNKGFDARVTDSEGNVIAIWETKK